MNIDEILHTVSSQRELADDENLNKRATKLLLDSHKKDIEKKNEEIEDLKQDLRQRKIFSYCIFSFMCLYMAASTVIVFLCGYEVMTLEPPILIALLTTTLANVIGVFNFVAKYLFHR